MPCTGFHCCKTVTDKIIVLSEKRSKFILHNPHTRIVAKIAFDGCKDYSASGKRCDHVLLLHEADKKAALFIELKGNKLPHAIQQLEASVQTLKMKKPCQIYAYVVTTRSPMISTEIQNEKHRLRKQGIKFDSRCGVMEKQHAEHFSG